VSLKPQSIALALGLGILSLDCAAAPTQAQGDTAERASSEAGDPDTRVLDLSALQGIETLTAKLADRRVVFVGETHDRYEHHLNQLAIVRAMHAQDPRLAIGLEFFQQPFQDHLDRYVAGELDEAGMLKGTEYFERWRYDYRLYRPILRFAREQGIPLIALNVPRELTEKVSEKGLDGLGPEERAQIPAQMDREDQAYRARIRAVFAQHPGSAERSFEHFLEAQSLWDEAMADRAARFLREYPDHRLVVLAGSGHLVYRQGIPNRLLRRVPATAAVVLNSGDFTPDPELADFLLYPQPVDLPRGGLMGVMLDTEKDAVSVKGFAEDSPAEKVGLKKGDRIERLAGTPIQSYSDIRLALMDHLVGDEVLVEVLRPGFVLDDERLDFRVTLY
jgi:uncharacterized iron-regulated protein